MDNNKKDYASPQLRRWGTVADLTQNGRTMPGADPMSGSGPGQGGGPPGGGKGKGRP